MSETLEIITSVTFSVLVALVVFRWSLNKWIGTAFYKD
jgi:hypothetical protein